MKGFFRQVAARGRAHAGVGQGDFIRKLLAPVHPGNVSEGAAEVGGNPVVRGVLDIGLRTVRENLPSPASLASIFGGVAARCHALFPHLSPAARQDTRAVCFLAANAIQNVPAETLGAALDGWLEGTTTPPTAVREIVGLVAVVGLIGALGVGDPETADRAALELWRLARAGEAEHAVDDAWDAAVLAEAEFEGGEPVPFVPMHAVG